VLATALLLLPFAIIVRGFGRVDFPALIFHAWAGMPGAGPSLLKNEILTATLALLVLLLALHLLATLWQTGHWAHVAIAALLLLANPLVAHMVERILIPPAPVDFAHRYVPPKTKTPAEPLPDIVLVYLEGLDRRFTDHTRWDDAYAPLAELAAQGATFTGVEQIAGTGWSLAGMIASQCGVPLASLGRLHNAVTEQVTHSFMPEVICLGDILARAGYKAEFIVGADARFAGIDAFYSTHGVPVRHDLTWFQTQIPAKELALATLPWGVDDQMVYDAARQRFDAMLMHEAPLFLIAETVGPHGESGFLSRNCTDDAKAEHSWDTGRVVHCLAEETARLVTDLRAAHLHAGRNRPLRIVLQSDHLNHGRSHVGGPLHLERNTLILLGGIEPGRVIDSPGSMVDVFPTLLEWLGFATPGTAAGLGRSLLTSGAEGQTLVAEFGVGPVDQALFRASDFFTDLWRNSH